MLENVNIIGMTKEFNIMDLNIIQGNLNIQSKFIISHIFFLEKKTLKTLLMNPQNYLELKELNP